MVNLLDHLRSLGVLGAQKVVGPNGAFISASTNPDASVRLTAQDDMKFTLPIGKNSQDASLGEYNVLIAEDGQAIATVNNYTVEESISFAVVAAPVAATTPAAKRVYNRAPKAPAVAGAPGLSAPF